MAQAIWPRDIEPLLAKAIRSRDIESLWSQAVERNESNESLWSEAVERDKSFKLTAWAGPNQLLLVAQLTAKKHSILGGSFPSYWKWTKETIGGKPVDVAELSKISLLHIDGKYAASKLAEGLHYEVQFVVKLKDNLNITHPVTLTLTLPDGTKQEKNVKLMEKQRNKIIGLNVGEFQAQGGRGDIKFSMMETELYWKWGLVFIGCLIIPKL